jgi:hypothetical protein
MGSSLKEAIQKKYAGDVIRKYAQEIKKVASLQGLLGNVYVDVSYYNSAEEAVQSIKRASTSPAYIIQSVKRNQFDDRETIVAKATGCQILPRDGKIDSKIASSYIDDLQFNNRLSSDTALDLKGTIVAGDNVLATLREAFMATQSYNPSVREGGVQAHFHQETKKYAAKDNIKEAAYKAVTAGISLEKIESKLSAVIPTVEAAGMVRDVLANTEEVDANVLTNCTVEKYQFSTNATLKEASKCGTCIHKNCGSCLAQNIKFAGAEEDGIIKLDAATEKVMLNENPDVAREDMSMELDMLDSKYGSGSNIMLDAMRGKEAGYQDIDTTLSGEGIDSGLTDV